MNSSHNSNKTTSSCEFGQTQNLSLSLTDIITFLVGQPLITRLLWVTFTSKKDKDILNCNLAIFLNFQYLMSLFHLVALHVQPQIQMQILRFMLVYAELGGPMNLTFICMQRYIAVNHPTSYPLMKKYRCREISALVVWIISVPVAYESTFGGNDISSFKDELTNTICFFVMVLMTVVITRFSFKIASTLRKSGPAGDKLSPGKRRAFTIVCVTSCINLCSYIPVALLQKFRLSDPNTYQCVILPASIFLLSTASVVHPLFYLHTQGKSSA